MLAIVAVQVVALAVVWFGWLALVVAVLVLGRSGGNGCGGSSGGGGTNGGNYTSLAGASVTKIT